MSSDSTFNPIVNPYIVGNPVEDQRMFFGREIDFEYIRTKFSASGQGGMIVLCGTRRSGKTSILFQVKQGRLGSGFLPVLLDMQAIAPESDVEFVHTLAAAIRTAAGERAPDVRFEPVSDSFADARAAFLAFCRDLHRALDGVSIIVMFDEYELFETNIEEGNLSVRVLDLLGEAIGGREGLFLLFAGSKKLEDRPAEYWASSLGRALFQRISFLREPDARSLIHDPVRGELEYGDGVPDRIIELGARQPFYTQALCQNLVDHLNDDHRREAHLEDIEAVALEVVDNPLPHMIFTWGAFTDPEKVVVASLGEMNREGPQARTADEVLQFLKEEKTGVTLAEDVLKESLERLFLDDILTKDESGELFDFRMDLWRLWIGRMHTIWQALDEIFGPEREDKPDPDVIRVNRRRWKRIGFSALTVTVLGLMIYAGWLYKETNKPPAVAVPDSSYFHADTTPEGARIFLDNYLLGTSPLDTVRVPAGRFEYRCELEGYRTVADSITLQKDLPDGITVDMEKLRGGLRIESTPPGATVMLNGEPLDGGTPLTVEGLSASELYAVRLSLDRYVPRSFDNVQVFPDSIVPLRHDFSVRRHGLTIATSPPGATVIFDGREVGISPHTLPSVEEGEHDLAVALAGYYGKQKRFDVPVPGNQIDIELVKHPPGRLVLTSVPFADIYVNGELVATSEMSHEMVLDEGEYVVEFRHIRFETVVRHVTIAPDETVTVEIDFTEQQ